MSSPQPSEPSLVPLPGHRLFTITPDDHRGQIWTVALIFGIFSVLTICLRGFISHGNRGRDDWSAAAASVGCVRLTYFLYLLTHVQLLGLGQLGSILAAATKGLGQNDDGGTVKTKVGSVSLAGPSFASAVGDTEPSLTLQLTMTSEAILLLGLALAKCSVLLVIRRIVSTRSLFCDALIGLSVLWGLASVLAITINCSPSQMIGVDGFCEHQVGRSFLEVLSIFDGPYSYSAGNSSLHSTR